MMKQLIRNLFILISCICILTTLVFAQELPGEYSVEINISFSFPQEDFSKEEACQECGFQLLNVESGEYYIGEYDAVSERYILTGSTANSHEATIFTGVMYGWFPSVKISSVPEGKYEVYQVSVCDGFVPYEGPIPVEISNDAYWVSGGECVYDDTEKCAVFGVNLVTQEDRDLFEAMSDPEKFAEMNQERGNQVGAENERNFFIRIGVLVLGLVIAAVIVYRIDRGRKPGSSSKNQGRKC